MDTGGNIRDTWHGPWYECFMKANEGTASELDQWSTWNSIDKVLVVVILVPLSFHHFLLILTYPSLPFPFPFPSLSLPFPFPSLPFPFPSLSLPFLSICVLFCFSSFLFSLLFFSYFSCLFFRSFFFFPFLCGIKKIMLFT